MNEQDFARETVRNLLQSAILDWGLDGLPTHDSTSTGDLIKAILDTQGLWKAPAALDEYWRLAGSPSSGLWQEFSRCGGFSIQRALSARMLAIETALHNGFDWKNFRYAAPILVFDSMPGGEALWVECDSDAVEMDEDPPVWLLTEELNKEPQLLAESFTSYLKKAIDRESTIRNPLG